MVGLMLSGCVRSQDVLVQHASNLSARKVTKSELVLICIPAEAEVELEGVPQGTCEDFRGEPTGLALGEGARRVRVQKRGYLPWETIVETGGTRVLLNVVLISAER